MHNSGMWPFYNRRVYLDHASATPICAESAKALAQALGEYANPGAIHQEGVAAKRVLEAARAEIAEVLSVKARQVIFASGSTEANNLCIVGLAQHLLRTRGSLASTHWVVSAIEHPSVLESFGEVERLGGIVTFLDPDMRGVIAAETLERALRPETVLVSVGWANSEIGVVQPMRELSAVIRSREERALPIPLFHSDLGQAPLYRSPQVHTLGIDMAVIGSGKLYGPRGIAAIYLSNDAGLVAQSWGGDQERGLRAGTENPALAAGFAAALHVAAARRDQDAAAQSMLRDELAELLCASIPDLIENTPRSRALPHILDVSIPGIDPEYVVLALDRAGVAISTKSACKAGEKSSHVVAALPPRSVHADDADMRAKTTLRFSLGRSTTERDIRRAAREVIRIVRT